MPRGRKKEPFNYASLELNRTVGLEIEGYMKTNPRTLIDSDEGIPNCSIRSDGSLRNCDWWDNHSSYGVEIVTTPLNSLTVLPEIFDSILSKGWSASGNASLHVHVDASDFSFHDRLKAAHFLKKIEDIMFLFVKNRRYDNRFCAKIPSVFTTILTDSRLNNVSNFGDLLDKIRDHRNSDFDKVNLGRYRWANIFRSHYNTIEFRLFHPIRKAEDGAMYAYMVHNVINLIKNCSIEQLEFIAQSINEESNIELKAHRFLEAIDLPYTLPIINDRAINAIVKAEQSKVTNALIHA